MFRLSADPSRFRAWPAPALDLTLCGFRALRLVLRESKIALQARLEKREHRGLFGFEPREILAQLLLDLFLDLQEERTLHIAGEHLRMDVALAADRGGVAEPGRHPLN